MTQELFTETCGDSTLGMITVAIAVCSRLTNAMPVDAGLEERSVEKAQPWKNVIEARDALPEVAKEGSIRVAREENFRG